MRTRIENPRVGSSPLTDVDRPTATRSRGSILDGAGDQRSPSHADPSATPRPSRFVTTRAPEVASPLSPRPDQPGRVV
jgi:hypothetical protein